MLWACTIHFDDMRLNSSVCDKCGHVCVSVLFSHSVMSNSWRPHDCSMPGLPVLCYVLEFAQTHVH